MHHSEERNIIVLKPHEIHDWLRFNYDHHTGHESPSQSQAPHIVDIAFVASLKPWQTFLLADLTGPAVKVSDGLLVPACGLID